MNKRVVIFVVLLAAMLLSATSAWPATLTINNWTGDNVYIKLEKYGVMKYFFTATVEGNTGDRNVSRFDVERKSYTATVTACGTTTTWGRMDLNRNLRLSFTDCDSMKQWWAPKYWGEPSQEKPNFYNDGDNEYSPYDGTWWGSYTWKDLAGTVKSFYFLYDVVP
ncbi:MAG: hypothetical protein GYA34_03125 [Chloroflexi bacterium]|nr:hypothetical protein [Chloroflexota bacterium]